MMRLMKAEAAASLARGEALTETSEEDVSSAISDDDLPPTVGGGAAASGAASAAAASAASNRQRQQQRPLRLFPGAGNAMELGQLYDDEDDRGHEADMDDTSIDSRAKNMPIPGVDRWLSLLDRGGSIDTFANFACGPQNGLR